jgi:hypothetical protein
MMAEQGMAHKEWQRAGLGSVQTWGNGGWTDPIALTENQSSLRYGGES